MTTSRLSTLLRSLSRHGYELEEQADDQAVIRDTKHDIVYALASSDDWVQAQVMLFEAADADASAARTALAFMLFDLSGPIL